MHWNLYQATITKNAACPLPIKDRLPMTTLSQLIDIFSPTTPFTPPANWFQGRTAYGGLSAALALQAVLAQPDGEMPSLRSAQITYIAPMADGLTFQVQALRQGKSASSVAVDCLVDGSIALRAAFIFANARQSRYHHELTVRPEVRAPESYAPPPSKAPLPIFFSNFDIRFVSAAVPGSGSDTPELLAWVRLREAAGVAPQVALLALGDCLPPATMACFTEPAPISSMNWTVDFVQQPADTTGWFLLRSRSLHAGEGYSYQLMEVWNEAGKLVMIGSQTVAIFA